MLLRNIEQPSRFPIARHRRAIEKTFAIALICCGTQSARAFQPAEPIAPIAPNQQIASKPGMITNSPSDDSHRSSNYDVVVDDKARYFTPKALREQALAAQRTEILMAQRASGQYRSRPSWNLGRMYPQYSSVRMYRPSIFTLPY